MRMAAMPAGGLDRACSADGNSPGRMADAIQMVKRDALCKVVVVVPDGVPSDARHPGKLRL